MSKVDANNSILCNKVYPDAFKFYNRESQLFVALLEMIILFS